MSEMSLAEIVRQLRDGAQGSPPMRAGVEVLLRAFDGRFGHPSRPWIVTESDGHMWVDADALQDDTGAMSGGERRILVMVAARIDEGPVDVVDVVTGLDRANLQLVLASLAHDAGWHERAEVTNRPAGVSHLTRPGPIVAWPT